MKKAIIRFEDIGPGGYYGTPVLYLSCYPGII